jgi:hypothetical protein
LPEEITRKGAFHRQKLNKAVVTLSIDDNYALNDGTCDCIRRLEENLYQGFLPKKCKCSDMITYQWSQDRGYNEQGHFSFYYNIKKDSISRASMLVYVILITAVSCLGSFFANIITHYMGL